MSSITLKLRVQAAVLQGIQLAFFKWTSSDAFFNDRSQPMSLVQAAVYGVATILADGLLVSNQLTC